MSKSYFKQMGKEIEVENEREQEEKRKLRTKLLASIKEYEKYWLIYSHGTYGVAGYFELPHKKTYIEILFHTPGSGKGPFIIHAFGNLNLNVNPIYNKYPWDSEIDPVSVIEDLENLIAQEFKKQYNKLKQEIDMLSKNQIVIKLQNQRYHFIVRLVYTNFYIDLNLDLSKYPRIPVISIKDELHEKDLASINKKIPIHVKESIENQLKKWKESEPLNLTEMIMDIETEIGAKINDSEVWMRKTTQFIEAKDLILGENYKEINFHVKKGEHLGFYSTSFYLMNNLFRVLAGHSKSYRGQLTIFGNQNPNEILPADQIQQGTKLRNRVLWINNEFTDEEKKKRIRSIVAGQRRVKNRALEATMLDFDKNRRISECTDLERLRIKIAIALTSYPGAIAFRIPEDNIGKIEYEQFSRVIAKIKEMFDCILLIHGPKEIIQQCDKVAIINENEVTEKAGSLSDLNESAPKSGELVIIQLTSPTHDQITKMHAILDTVIIEIRMNEKYKVFSQIPPEKLTVLLFQIFGTKIYSYQRKPIQLADLLELNQFQSFTNAQGENQQAEGIN